MGVMPHTMPFSVALLFIPGPHVCCVLGLSIITFRDCLCFFNICSSIYLTLQVCFNKLTCNICSIQLALRQALYSITMGPLPRSLTWTNATINQVVPKVNV